jgi:hypothetical protein
LPDANNSRSRDKTHAGKPLCAGLPLLHWGAECNCVRIGLSPLSVIALWFSM